MAEGGQEDDKNNPFSFKNFVTKKDKPSAESKNPKTDDDIDIFSISDAGTRRKKEKSRQIIVVEEEEIKLPKKKDKKDKKENPFSFKKFLSGPTEGAKPRIQETNRGPDVIGGDLPDFVQDHYSGSSPQGSPRLFDLPDFTQAPSSVSDIGGFNNVQYSSGNSRHDVTSSVRTSQHESAQRNSSASIPLVSNSDSAPHETGEDDDDDDELDNEHQHVIGVGHSLPDFLSDTGLRGNAGSDDVNLPGFHSSVITSSEQSVQIQQLKDSNAKLRMQIEDLRKQKARDTESITALKHDLADQKKKEAEETATMERAMEQVEANLSSTTKRAVQAEATVTKLKQEVKGVQAELLSLRGRNGITGDQFHTELKERTKYVADQLTAATKTAETSLKQLLSGVDNLTMLSQVLMSIDKISEQVSSPEDKQSDTL